MTAFPRSVGRLRSASSAEGGAALLIALMALLLLSAFGLALVLVSSAEIATAANYRDREAALQAADASLERAVAELLATENWDEVLSGLRRSSRVDGGPGGERQIPAGGDVDLTAVAGRLNCGKPAGCSPGEMDAVTAARPWGPNNPRYRLFAYGPLLAGFQVATAGPYVVVMVADDPMENDGDPARDGAGDGNPGRGRLLVRAEAFGPGHAHQVVEAAIFRPCRNAGDTGYTGQAGGGESNSKNAEPLPVPVSPAARTLIGMGGST